jgi:penicillin-binding protein 2
MTSGQLERKAGLYSIAVLLVFGILVGRIGMLQIVRGQYYEKLSEGNRIRLVNIPAPRGTISDRYGQTLVSNRPAYTVSLMYLNVKDMNATIEKLAPILEMPVAEISKKVEASRSRLFEPIKIKQDIGPAVHTRIEEMRDELPGVIIEVEQVRDYLHNDLAFHAVGYVGEITEEQLGQPRFGEHGYRAGDIVGKDGLEDVYDELLKGTDGGQQVEVDHRGKPARILGQIAPKPGNNLTLTLDAGLQRVAEETLRKMMAQAREGKFGRPYPNAKAGAAVAIDVRSGEILAIASLPSVDPNRFASGISSDSLAKLIADPLHPFTSRATFGTYPPGSTFKMITGLAALQGGLVKLDELFLDTGTYSVIPKKCWVEGGHGLVNLERAYACSCNIVFYELGRRAGINAIESLARMFGFGELTGVDLPGEARGTVAGMSLKQSLFERKLVDTDQWMLSETLDAAIGQGFTACTPLQLASYVAALVNGGTRYRPHLAKEVVAPDGTVVKKFEPEAMGKVRVDASNLEFIKKALYGVSSSPEGTSNWLFRDFPVKVGSKTGTAENAQGDSHGWFVAFAPYEQPEIAIAVIVEQAGSGSMAGGPVAKAMLEHYFGVGTGTPATSPR